MTIIYHMSFIFVCLSLVENGKSSMVEHAEVEPYIYFLNSEKLALRNSISYDE